MPPERRYTITRDVEIEIKTHVAIIDHRGCVSREGILVNVINGSPEIQCAKCHRFGMVLDAPATLERIRGARIDASKNPPGR